MELIEFLKQTNPEVIEQYKRLTTPNYWECGVLYYPQRSGCSGSGKNYRELRLVSATVFKSDKHFTLKYEGKEEGACCILQSEAHIKLMRVDEDVEYKDNMINDGTISYLISNDVEYMVRQHYSKGYDNGRVNFTISVRAEGSGMIWEYYNYIGKAEPVLKITRPKKNIMERDDYDIYFKTSVRKFKEIVFGDPNIKIPSTKGKIWQLKNKHN